MYSSFQIARKYLKYYLNASNGKGHGVHSPFVFDFINKVLTIKTTDLFFANIEQERYSLLNDTSII